MPFLDSFRSRRVLVTGHTGFKGSWLTLWLEALGAQVLGYSLAPERDSLFERATVGKGIQHITGDVRAYEPLRDVFDSFHPDIVFHLAAQALVRRSYAEPRATFDTNVGGTVNVLEAARMTKSVRAVVVVTSDKCYDNREWVWGYRESDALGGDDPYSASKGAAELVVGAYLRSFFGVDGRGVASVRAGNVIGGGDFAVDRILPDAVRAIQARQPLEVRNPLARRPWQHVLDPLAGYLALGAKLLENPAKYSGAWNFGPHHDDVLRVGPLVKRFFQAIGAGHSRDACGTGPHEANLLWLACDKAAMELDWHPVLAVGEAIDRTARWYRDVVFNGADARAACAEDRASFLENASMKGAWWTR
jgi:CDP-glucose 4,6-dehydratase